MTMLVNPYRYGTGPTAAINPTFANVKLLIGANGVDGSTTFTDESGAPHTLTAVGNAQIDTAVSKFGTGSILLDGAGDCISSPDSNDWELDQNDNKTWEMWVRFAAGANLSVAHVFASKWNTSLSQRSWAWSYDGTVGGMRLLVTDTGASPFGLDMQRTWSPSVSTWYHVAFSRTGANVWRMFVDGVQLGASVTLVQGDLNGTAPLRIGAQDSAGSVVASFNGWIDEVRFCTEALYTADFIPPAAAFPRS